MAESLRIDKVYFYLLTSGIDEHLVCQALSTYSSTPYPNVGDYKGRTGLSPLVAYPSTVEFEANEGSLYSRHHVYAIDYYSSIDQSYSSSLGPSIRVSIMGMDDEPANK